MVIALPANFSHALVAVNVPKLEDKQLKIEDLTKILGSTIKHDDTNKTITFLGMLLTYTEEDQINIGFLAESSTGKSYIPLELSCYFPQDDLIEVGYASPTAFFHDYSALLKPVKGKRKAFAVDLHQKILIFIDQPHDLLLQRLRPILSHDKKVIRLMITDRNKNKNLRTSHILVQGYPTVIFASAKFSLSEQEKTRLLLLSPEVTQEKLKESISLRLKKESNRKAFRTFLENDKERKFLIQKIQDIKQAKIESITIPSELADDIYERFMEKHKELIPRHQRDVSRLLALIKAIALLNFRHRERIDDSIVATQEDVEAGFKLYENISEANELGLSPELYNIYMKLKTFIEKKVGADLTGVTIADFQSFYGQNFYRKLNYDAARETLKIFVSMGLLTEELDQFDRRIRRYLLPQCVLETKKSTQ
jgi:hypothetical protein